MSDQGKRSRRGYMYTPFGGTEALHAALGENMTRIVNGKKTMALIAPSHEMADNLEQTRQRTLANFNEQIQATQQQIGGVGDQQRQNDANLLARIRRSVEAPNATAQSTWQARHNAFANHEFMRDINDTLETGYKTHLSMLHVQHKALSETRILNTSPGIYPDLFPDPPLKMLSPDGRHSRGDKLYVLGHGSPGDDTLYAQRNGEGGKLDAKALALHLKDAGLPSDAMDVRLTACQGVPKLGKEQQVDDPVKATRDSGYLVPELARELHGLGFRDLTVTGYQGNGVTFPFDSRHRLRAAPGKDDDRTRRSALAIRYPVKDMGE